jgi:5S rRNA maturation endonuclease (ribonuclease M5)
MNMVPDQETHYYLRQFQALYLSSIPCSKLSWDRIKAATGDDSIYEELQAFKSHKGNPITLVDCKDHTDLIPTYKPFYPFYASNDKFWMIPCETPNSLIGFMLRGWRPKDRKHKYVRFQISNSMPLLFGLDSFGDFRARAPKTSPFNDQPIILVEGVKDALYIKKFYPYTLALLTNYASEHTCELISMLSRQIIISMDRDRFGVLATKKLSKKFIELGTTAVELYQPNVGNKDWGSGFSDTRFDQSNLSRIRSGLGRFGVEI